eukprot:scaffold752_cov322-Pavlova_lutheri.AAC.15
MSGRSSSSSFQNSEVILTGTLSYYPRHIWFGGRYSIEPFTPIRALAVVDPSSINQHPHL